MDGGKRVGNAGFAECEFGFGCGEFALVLFSLGGNAATLGGAFGKLNSAALLSDVWGAGVELFVLGCELFTTILLGNHGAEFVELFGGVLQLACGLLRISRGCGNKR